MLKSALKTKITARKIQIALGLLWLFDGLLQLQHQMFTSNFATRVISPAAYGQPRIVSGIMHFSIHIFLFHPTVFNTFVVITQLSLGLLILCRRTVKIGLILSVIWGLVVWSVGEGYGGIFSAHTSILMGAPGAALLYVLIALAVLPLKEKPKQNKNPQTPAYWLALLWLALWVGGGIYQLLPGQDSISSLSSMVVGNVSGAPVWLGSIKAHIASFINSFGSHSTSMSGMHMTTMQMAQMPARRESGYMFIFLFAVLMICIGIGVLIGGKVRKISITSGIILSLVFWVVGQNLGGYYTGIATDPNSGPLFVLLGLAILGCSNLDQNLSVIGAKTEYLLVGHKA